MCCWSLAGLVPVMDHGWAVAVAAPGGGAQLSLVHREASAPVDEERAIGVDDVEACYDVAVRAGFGNVHPLTDDVWGIRHRANRDQKPLPRGALIGAGR